MNVSKRKQFFDMGCSPSKKAVVLQQNQPVTTEDINTINTAEGNSTADNVDKPSLDNNPVNKVETEIDKNQNKLLSDKDDNKIDKNEENGGLRLDSVTKVVEQTKSVHDESKNIDNKANNIDNKANNKDNESVNIDIEEVYEETEERALIEIERLNETLKRFTIDETILVDIIAARSKGFIELLKRLYKEKFDEDLGISIQRKTSGLLQHFFVQLLHITEELVAGLLHKAVIEKKYHFIAEIFTAWDPLTLEKSKECYLKTYNSNIEHDIEKTFDDHTPISLKTIMTPLSRLRRSNDVIEDDVITSEINSMGQKGEEISNLLVSKTHSREWIARLCKEYERKYYVTLNDSIEVEFHEETKDVLQTIVSLCEDAASYFTDELKLALEENKEQRLFDILISRKEIDLPSIKRQYTEVNEGTTLIKSIKRLNLPEHSFNAVQKLIQNAK